MEVKSFSSDVAAFGKIVVNSVLEAVVAETLLVTQRSVASLLMVVGCLLKDGAPLSELATIAPSSKFVSIAPLSELISPDRRFPFEALSQKNQACTENKDGSDTEDDNDDDDGDAEDQDDDDDANDEDFSGEEGGDDEEEEGDPEEDPAANGNEGLSSMISSGMASSVPASQAVLSSGQSGVTTMTGAVPLAGSAQNTQNSAPSSFTSTAPSMSGQTVPAMSQGNIPGTQMMPSGTGMNQNMLTGLGATGLPSGTGTMMPTPGMSQQGQPGMQPVGVNSTSV